MTPTAPQVPFLDITSPILFTASRHTHCRPKVRPLTALTQSWILGSTAGDATIFPGVDPYPADP